VASGSAIRGSRVGAGPMGEAERGDSAPRHRVVFWCANGHETRPSSPPRRPSPRPGTARAAASRPPGPRQPARGPQDRAVQDPPGLREGAAQRRRRRGHPQRGAGQAPRPVARTPPAPSTARWAGLRRTRPDHRAALDRPGRPSPDATGVSGAPGPRSPRNACCTRVGWRSGAGDAAQLGRELGGRGLAMTPACSATGPAVDGDLPSAGQGQRLRSSRDQPARPAGSDAHRRLGSVDADDPPLVSCTIACGNRLLMGRGPTPTA
jgi:hypothetical protein